jgi:hypothetical protein
MVEGFDITYAANYSRSLYVVRLMIIWEPITPGWY